MRRTTRTFCFAFAILMVTVALPSIACGQKKAGQQKKHVGSPKDLAVDVVFHKDGQRFHGVLTKNDKRQVTVAVERAWLEKKYPKFYRQHLATEEMDVARQLDKQIQRIESWLDKRTDSPELTFFLEGEREKVKQRIANPELNKMRFTLLTIWQKDIRRIVQQKNEQRKIALVAWKQGLADVPDRSAKSLNRELVAAKVDFDNVDLDFADDVPASGQSDRAWAVRQAMVEYDLIERADYQGFDGMFMEEGADLNAAGILRIMMGNGGNQLQQIGEMLDLPEFTRNKTETPKSKDWWKETAAKVDKKGLRCFSITRMGNDMLADQVQIEVALIAKDDKDQWVKVSSFFGTARGSQQDKSDIAGLKDDPRIKKALETVGQFGVLDQKTIEKAMLRGLATQKALQNAKGQFGEFLSQFTERLDGNEVPVSN